MKPSFTLLGVAAAVVFAAANLSMPALAKLPAPSDEAKAKAAEATAKTAHGNKLASYQLCKSMDAVAAAYFANAKAQTKTVKEATATDACVDPGPFVYVPPVPASGATPGAAPTGAVVAAAPAAGAVAAAAKPAAGAAAPAAAAAVAAAPAPAAKK
jgi:hypothetical protein